MVALADCVESCTLVAVIVTACEALMAEGAAYNPFVDTVPIEGDMDQVTAVLPLPLTVGMNCILCDGARVAVNGLRLTLRLFGISWMVAVPAFVGSTTLAAVMVRVCGVVMAEGAAYDPFDDRVPTDGVIDQVTPVFVVPITVAVKILPCEGVRVDVKGVRLTLTLGRS